MTMTVSNVRSWPMLCHLLRTCSAPVSLGFVTQTPQGLSLCFPIWLPTCVRPSQKETPRASSAAEAPVEPLLSLFPYRPARITHFLLTKEETEVQTHEAVGPKSKGRT